MQHTINQLGCYYTHIENLQQYRNHHFLGWAKDEFNYMVHNAKLVAALTFNW